MALEKLYSVEEVAEMTAVTTRTIRNYLRKGSFNRHKNRRAMAFSPGGYHAHVQSGKKTLQISAKPAAASFATFWTDSISRFQNSFPSAPSQTSPVRRSRLRR